ncbi:MAG TPA: hypothetical protein VHE81_02935 [Lacipirellulaceae bacterium]|nr:hypothetical protein [Lacipirellulaceae bacterium]
MKKLSYTLPVAIIAIVAALFLGYSQYRRQVILQECKALSSDRVKFTLSDGWIDRVWQRLPTDIVVTISANPTSQDNAREIRIRDRLKSMGAKDVHYYGPAMPWPQ